MAAPYEGFDYGKTAGLNHKEVALYLTARLTIRDIPKPSTL